MGEGLRGSGGPSLWCACLNAEESDEGRGGGIVYCAKGKQRGHSAGDY